MPPATLKPVLMQMGMSASFVDLLLEMSDALNSGYMKALEPRSAGEHNGDDNRRLRGGIFRPGISPAGGARLSYWSPSKERTNHLFLGVAACPVLERV